MFSDTASTRQSPAGGPGSPEHLDGLLTELRRGERAGFLRYFQHFRAPVYDFTLRLLGDETAAVAATTEAFVVGFRRVIVDAADTDLRIMTWQCALDACTARAAAQVTSGARTPSVRAAEAPRTHRLHGPTGPRRRFEAALEPLDLRWRAALLFHDLHGLSLAETAAIFAISEDAAGTLLFRAREQFRRAFDERPADLHGGSCRLAERAAAGAVGLGLGDDDLLRLRRHAGYCRPCHSVMKTWGAGAVGLAVFLEQAALPRALSTPVFRGAAESVMPAAAGAGVLRRSLGSLGRAVRSRTAAYVIAAACIALAAGVAFREDGVRQFIFVQSAGPSIRLVTQQPSKQAKRDGAGTPSASPSSSGSKAAGSATSSQPLPAASFTTAQVSSGTAASAGSSPGREEAAPETGSAKTPSANASSGAESAAGAGAGAGASGEVDKGWQHATKHKSHGARADDHAWAAGFGHTKTTHHGRSEATHHGRSEATHHGHSQATHGYGKATHQWRTSVTHQWSTKTTHHGRSEATHHSHSQATHHSDSQATHGYGKATHHGSGQAAGHSHGAGAARATQSGGHHAASGRGWGSHGSSGDSHRGKSHSHSSGRSHGSKDH